MQTACCGTGQALCSLYNRSRASEIDRGGRVTLPRIIHLFMCVACCWRINYLWTTLHYMLPQRTPDHQDLSRFSWRTCDWFWITPRLPGGARGRTEIRRLLRHLWISTLTFLMPLQCSFHVFELFLFEVYRPSVTTHYKNKMRSLLYNIKSGRNDYCLPRNPVNVTQEKRARGGGLGGAI